MLKFLGECAVAALTLYAVKGVIRREVDRAYDEPTTGKLDAVIRGAESSMAVGCIVVGSAVCFPVTATVGAVRVVRDVYENRREIADTVRAVPQFVQDKYHALRGTGVVETPTLIG